MSGFYFTKSDGSGHQALPVRGSYRSEKTRQPANLRAGADYPVTAECQWCHQVIRLERVSQMEWTHAPVASAAPAGDAP